MADRPAQDPPATRPARSPAAAYAAVLVVCAVIAVGYVLFATLRGGGTGGLSNGTPGPTADPAVSLQPLHSVIVFQNVRRDAGYAHVATVPLDAPGSERTIRDLTCERTYFAGTRGICLVPERGVVSTYHELVYDANFQTLKTLPLDGAPSRARVSADGAYGATTGFVFGHSYADAQFSTATAIVDLGTGSSFGNLETFSVSRDGQAWSSPDFNFWGVTFAPTDRNRFYATLRSINTTYLLQGDIAARTLKVIGEGVECPSLSPDGTRIAFKHLNQGLVGSWRLTVMDLATMAETPLAETANIDDQPEWLDNGSVIYGNAGNVWSVPADGTGTPSLLIADALSPAVVR